MQDNMFIGLDVHKATISVAIAKDERGGEVRHWGTVPHRPDHLRKLVEKLGANGSRLHFCYEAGPCGYGLHRQIVEMGHDCIVVAPSLIPVKAGDRVKTDRRDAIMLAKLHRAGELTSVWVPDAAHEAMRDLVRARATAMRVLGKARQHLQGFPLRHGRIYPGKKGWTVAYWSCNVAWWPVQRPDIVFDFYPSGVGQSGDGTVDFEDGARSYREWFRGFDSEGNTLSESDGYDQMVYAWDKLGMVLPQRDAEGRVITVRNAVAYREYERNPALNSPPAMPSTLKCSPDDSES